MIILGIHTGHNASACLMIDGRVVGMIQEERFTKRKNQTGYPKESITSLLKRHLDGTMQDVDRVVVASEEDDPYWVALDHYSNFGVKEYVAEMHDYWKPFFYPEDGSEEDGTLYSGDGKYWKDRIDAGGDNLNHDYHFDLSFINDMSWDEAFKFFNSGERLEITRRLFNYDGPIETINHHACHGYYALYGQSLPTENFSNTLVLTADSEGDGSNWSVSIPRPDGSLSLLAHGNDNHVARLYKFVTLILGMKPNEHEYKVMGLSGYSKSRRHIKEVEDVLFEAFDFEDGKFVRRTPLKDSYFDLGARLEGFRFDNIAAAAQNWATEVTAKWMKYWISETGRSGVCFSGGLSMNIKMNGIIAQEPEIDWMNVPASGGDESLAAGACFFAMKSKSEQADGAAQVAPGDVVPMEHVYLGDTPDMDWESGIKEAGGSKEDYGVLEGVGPEQLAKLLAADKIMARCVGESEFGARALGNRSILANPSNGNNLKTINDAIKNRDFWMPFTPSILQEYLDEYIENPKGLISPYMTIGFQTRPEARPKLAAAIHPGDFSARPQTVIKAINSEYWTLIDEFRKLTGVASLLNTSLNLHGDPMNYSLADAARTVALSDLEFLIMPEDRLLFKKSAEPALHQIL